MMLKIAVIGAGLAGLTTANLLKNYAEVTVFEKAHKVGGRMATKNLGGFECDHGAQFFKTDTAEFRNFIEPMLKDGIISEWCARFVEFEKQDAVSKRLWDKTIPHYVGVPNMNAIPKYLSKNLTIYLNECVTPLKQNQTWIIVDNSGNSLGNFDWVIVTTPVHQTLKLIPTSFAYYNYLSTIKMLGCFSLILGFDQALPLDYDAALVRDADISWISVNSSKPGRGRHYCILIHSTNKWADSQLDGNQQEITQYLCDQASYITGYDMNVASHKALHRWRYANINKQLGEKHFIDFDEKLAVCGDWCIQGRVEAAFTSALGLAEKLISHIS